MRGFLGIVAGLVAAIAAAMLIAFIGGLVIPPAPVSVDMSSVDGIRDAYSSLGTNAQLLGVVSWAGGGLVGALVAKHIIGRPWAAWTIAALTEAYMLVNVLMLPMPGWMQAVALILPLIAGFLANHLIKNRVDDDEVVSEGNGIDAEA
ncbi:MAG: hypothetical protein H0W74_01865 [Sphingosinicella sp.]|nr:hypothetical protein [Sphingosinicella sp.]